MTNRAAIFAIGSELLNGQITNRNGAWISQELFSFGVETELHIVVDDDREQIKKWLKHASDNCDHIFITGGLGPTSDDLTRDAVAEYCQKELIFDEGSWEHVKEIFTNFKRALPAQNRQQCYFPEGATILHNAAGTANGFYLTHEGRHIWVLPGPPLEIEAIWQDALQDQLKDLHSHHHGFCVRKWRTIALGESTLAEMVDPIISGSGAEVAYRAHAPFVELKVRYPFEKAAEFRALRMALLDRIQPWLFETDSENKAAELSQLLDSRGSAWIYDAATESFLSQLLGGELRKTNLRDGSFSFVSSYETTDDPEEFIRECLGWADEVDVALAITGFFDSGEWSLGVKQGEDIVIKSFPSPYQGEALRRRNQHAIAALAIKEWLAVLKDQLQH